MRQLARPGGALWSTPGPDSGLTTGPPVMRYIASVTSSNQSLAVSLALSEMVG